MDWVKSPNYPTIYELPVFFLSALPVCMLISRFGRVPLDGVACPAARVFVGPASPKHSTLCREIKENHISSTKLKQFRHHNPWIISAKITNIMLIVHDTTCSVTKFESWLCLFSALLEPKTWLIGYRFKRFRPLQCWDHAAGAAWQRRCIGCSPSQLVIWSGPVSKTPNPPTCTTSSLKESCGRLTGDAMASPTKTLMVGGSSFISLIPSWQNLELLKFQHFSPVSVAAMFFLKECSELKLTSEQKIGDIGPALRHGWSKLGGYKDHGLGEFVYSNHLCEDFKSFDKSCPTSSPCHQNFLERGWLKWMFFFTVNPHFWMRLNLYCATANQKLVGFQPIWKTRVKIVHLSQIEGRGKHIEPTYICDTTCRTIGILSFYRSVLRPAVGFRGPDEWGAPAHLASCPHPESPVMISSLHHGMSISNLE